MDDSWRRDHGGGILEEEYGGGTMEGESGRHLGGMWEALWELLEALGEASWELLGSGGLKSIFLIFCQFFRSKYRFFTTRKKKRPKPPQSE